MITKTIKTTSNAEKINLQSCEEPCLIERGMRVLGGKWKASILWHLKDGPVRFNELSRMLGGASKKMVDQRPIAVAYEITDFGRTALDILEKLKDWTQANNI
jgi:DNA-binding HxlR family transcriptional regulator